MEKQRTHLTPEEVQEFMGLGVELREIACVWCENKHGYELQESQEGYAKLDLYENVEDWEIKSILPAPNLQEVLEVLPKVIIRDEEEYRLILAFCEALNSWAVLYRSSYERIPYKDPILFKFVDDNLLVAVINLLRLVCKHHPETLTKAE